jgi:tyrosine-protein phosphatase YwqE
LLPGLDDGVQSEEESLEVIRTMRSFGIQSAITTPHVMQDTYRNTPEGIRNALKAMQIALSAASIDFKLEAAAEYYFDEGFLEKLKQPDKLLLFSGRHILFELSFLNEPSILFDSVFQMQMAGILPVLAHPERYLFFHKRRPQLAELRQRGVLFQLNVNSLTGYYGDEVRKTAEWLVTNKMIDFIGSDCHGMRHLEAMQHLPKSKYYRMLSESLLLNNTL